MNMGVNLNFDANTVQPNVALDPIPSGWYNAQITESSLEPTSKPGGQMLKLTMTVMDGPFAQRKVFDRLNLVNENPTAQEIAYKTLSAICRATGVMQCQNSQQLHGIPMKVKVKLKNAETGADGKQYDASNEVRGYDHINSDHVVNNSAGPAVVPGVAGAPGGTPPWAQGGPAAAAPPGPAAGVPAGAFPGPAMPPPGPAMAAPNAPQPWQQPGAPAAPNAPAAPAPFPPAGWQAHPTAPGYFYQGQEVLSEADLRARFPAPPPAPVAAAPAAPAGVPAAPGGTPPWAAAAAAAPAAPSAPAAPAVPAAPQPPQTANPTGPVMLAAATTSYEEYRKAGWSDEAMIEHGIMAPPAAPSAPGTAPAPAAPAGNLQAPPWAR